LLSCTFSDGSNGAPPDFEVRGDTDLVLTMTTLVVCCVVFGRMEIDARALRSLWVLFWSMLLFGVLGSGARIGWSRLRRKS
jgi:NhaP-type Na+/H+ or K+/H+ antiporter